jgi:DNA (cytosine-5)-methyltransferase 1
LKHLGDITKINGAEVEPVWCITGGSPCQDLSIAGKRAGLAGTRSGLYMEQIRIVKEMREHDRSIGRTGELVRPRYMVWENVPGAFSSNFKDGFGDFGAVLEEAVRIAEPGFSLPRLPDKQRWTKSGGIVGDGWSVAWRTHDAQYWGVPQRRRRISMVVDFNGHTAGDILFERFGGAESSGVHEVVADPGRESRPEVQPDAEGVRRDSPEGGTAREETAGGAENCSGAPIFCLQGNGIDRADTAGCNGKGWKEDISYTLNTIDRPAVCAGFKGGQGEKAGSIGYSEEVSPTLSAAPSGSNQVPNIVAFAQNQRDEVRDLHGVAGALAAEPGMKQQTYIFDMTHANDVIRVSRDVSTSWQARMGTGGNQIPLTFSMQYFGDYKENEISSSCKQRDSKDATDLVVGIDDEKNAYIDQFGTLKAHASGGTQQHVMERMVVRRLTPLECTRLQGYPDGWVSIGDWTDEKGRVHKEADAPKYKALGNSIALPFWRWMFGRMAAYLPEGATLGSLFDGIGGFPLCWESIHGAGSARWASEIEEFPIAVTKHHFEESNNK